MMSIHTAVIMVLICHWVDHILCSRSVDILVSSLSVLYDYVSSDLKPIPV